MTRSPKTLAVCFAMLVLPAALWAQGVSTVDPLSAAERAALSPSRATLEQGRSVADSACAKCHGMDGASTGPGVPSLAGPENGLPAPRVTRVPGA